MDYDERLGVPLRWWVQGTLLVASLFLALVVVPGLPFVVTVGISLAAFAMMAAFFLSYGGARVQVGDGQLTAGRARIPVGLLGDVTALDRDQTRLLAGRDADARAYLLLRPYLKRSVRVDLEDPADPTPYWLVSTRHPRLLAAALGRVVVTSTQED